MIKKLSISVFVLLMIPFVLQAQDQKFVPKAPNVVDNQESVRNSTTSNEVHVASANYVIVDSMANAFGPAISTLNPMPYDPYANVIAFLHRGHSSYAAGSGQLWYNISTDEGATWTRVSAVNTSPILARYPSMAISNPTQGPLSATTAVFSWPELSSSFEFVGYGADQPVGAGTPFADTIHGPNAYSSQVPCWASDNSAWVFWSSDNQINDDIEVWRTQDFSTIESSIIPSAAFLDGANITIGGVSFNGTQYLAVLGTYPDPDTLNPIQFGWYPGYFTSTDNGVTWSMATVIDFRTIPALSAYDQLLDYEEAAGTIRFDGDINVDMNGHLHFALGLTDTSTTPWTHTIVDIFQTGTGWDATIIANIETEPFTGYLLGPGLGQMGYSPYLAFDQTRSVMAVQWVDKNPTTEWMDLWFSYKTLDATTWSTPMNLTESPEINNTQSHMANMLSGTGPDYKAFSMYGYVAGANGPYSDTLTTTNIYVAPVPFTIVGVNDVPVVNSFELEQNYPNPFNPSTLIKYSIAERSSVTIRVFDMLGREVTTLVNRTQEAGSYSVNFDASNLSSGMYVYSLNAGNYSATKKMMLMK